MKLKEYLEKTGIKATHLSKVLNISRYSLTAINNDIPVSKETADKLIEWSKGEIEISILSGKNSHVRNRSKKKVPQC